MPGLEAKIRLYLLRSPNGVWSSNCLKIYPVAVCFLLTELAWLPALGFLKQGGGPQLLSWGPSALQGALDQVTPVWHLVPSDTLPQPDSSWAILLWPRNMFASLGKYRETYSPDCGIETLSPGLEVWHLRSETLAANRGLKTKSLWMPFLLPRKIVLPGSCILRVMHSWKALAWRSFFSGNGPWGPAPREGSHTPRECQSKLQTSVLSRFLCRRELVSLGLSGMFLDLVGKTPCASTWILGLGVKIRIQVFGVSLLSLFWIILQVECLFPVCLFGLWASPLFFHVCCISVFSLFFLLCLRAPFPRP